MSSLLDVARNGDADRYRAIERALRLNTSECGFKKACILEGELLVYNDLVSGRGRCCDTN